jgi:hypothetical protein
MVLPGPKPPGDPGISFRQLNGGDSDASQNRIIASVDGLYDGARDFRDHYVTHQRNVFLAGAALAAQQAAIGLALPAAVNYLRWGLLLGAAFALVWASWMALRAVPHPAPAPITLTSILGAGEPEPLDFAGRFLRFAVSFVSLIVLLFLGLWRLTEWPARGGVVAVPAAGASAPPVPREAAAWAPPATSSAPPATSSAPPAPSGTAPTAPLSPSRPESPSAVTGTMPNVTDGSARAEASPPAESMQWGRPGDAGEPERRPESDS